MNDYSELIKELKRNGLSSGSALGHHSVLCDDAADAIEQLVAECNRLQSVYDEIDKAHHDTFLMYCKMKHERDAAVADIEEVIHDEFGDICTICNKYKACMKATKKTPLAKLPCERGKWRGVMEDNR